MSKTELGVVERQPTNVEPIKEKSPEVTDQDLQKHLEPVTNEVNQVIEQSGVEVVPVKNEQVAQLIKEKGKDPVGVKFIRETFSAYADAETWGDIFRPSKEKALSNLKEQIAIQAAVTGGTLIVLDPTPFLRTTLGPILVAWGCKNSELISKHVPEDAVDKAIKVISKSFKKKEDKGSENKSE